MPSNIERFKKDLKDLLERGSDLQIAFLIDYLPESLKDQFNLSNKAIAAMKKEKSGFVDGYQSWYSEAKALIKQLMPDRLDDFIRYYEKPRHRKEITYATYTIADCLEGLTVTKGLAQERVVGPADALRHFQQQLLIAKALEKRFESSLFDIRQLVQADLFDSELEAANELRKKGFLRAAGAVAGVVLEKHLGLVAGSHNLATKKSHPAISDFNDMLKSANIIDVPEWRRIQRLGDIRNLCDHNKHRDPTNEEIDELIQGAEKLTKTLF